MHFIVTFFTQREEVIFVVFVKTAVDISVDVGNFLGIDVVRIFNSIFTNGAGSEIQFCMIFTLLFFGEEFKFLIIMGKFFANGLRALQKIFVNVEGFGKFQSVNTTATAWL